MAGNLAEADFTAGITPNRLERKSLAERIADELRDLIPAGKTETRCHHS